MPTYLYRGDQGPTLPVPTTGLQDPTNPAPLVYDLINQGESSTTARGKLSEGMAFAEMLGRHGGGAYAVATGLNLSIGAGLVVTVAPGFAMIDGPVPVTAAYSVAVTNGVALGTIWLTQAGTPTPSANLVAPGGNCAFLGFYVSAGGVITSVDEACVLRYDQGGYLMRRTADTAPPSDSQNAALRFLTKCPAGLFFWDGFLHHAIGGDQAGLSPTSIGAGEVWTIPAGRQAVLQQLDVGGTLTVNGLLRVLGE